MPETKRERAQNRWANLTPNLRELKLGESNLPIHYKGPPMVLPTQERAAHPHQSPMKILPLREYDKKNFETLKLAAGCDHLCLVSSIRKSDGAQVALVCAMGRKNGYYLPVPLAVMVEGNPFEDFADPASEDEEIDRAADRADYLRDQANDERAERMAREEGE